MRSQNQPDFNTLESVHGWGTQNSARKVQIGKTTFLPLRIGQESATLPRKKLLSYDCFCPGELVSIVRENGLRTIGQVQRHSRESLDVACGNRVVKSYTANQVEMHISKLIGAYYLVDERQPNVPSLPTARSELVKIGRTSVTPVQLGRDATNLSLIPSLLPIEYYYQGEAVCLSRADGRREIGAILEITTESIVVNTGRSQETIAAGEVPETIKKLKGSFYLASPAPDPSKKSKNIVPMSGYTAEEVTDSVKDFFRRQDDQKILDVFFKHADAHSSRHRVHILRKENLQAALDDLGVHVQEGAVDAFFRNMDVNEDGVLDQEEFKQFLEMPLPAEAWAQSLNLPRLLAYVLPNDVGSQEATVSSISKLEEREIEAICEGFCNGLRQLLCERVKLLHEAMVAMETHHLRSRNHKFDVIKMDNCGTIEDFHLGLHGRIGFCSLNFFKGMEAEHCSKKGCNSNFKTSNFNITTCPQAEWNIVVNRAACPENHMGNKRRIPDIDELCRIELARKSNLHKEEVIALVLYTGPMYHVYNSILRRHPKELYEVYSTGNNLFSTTIAVIVSAVLKISRVSKLPEGQRLYRGLGGTTDLPDSFFKRDSNGLKGFLEWGFMSTTSNKDIAIKYSGAEDNKPLPLVLSIRVGSVDRGASIREFSQYEDELEYLYIPCSFLQQDGNSYLEVSKTSVVTVYPVKVNTNLKTMTIEEHLGHKKKMHIAAFRYLIDEIDSTLHAKAKEKDAADRLARELNQLMQEDRTHTVDGFLERIVQQCRDVLARHEAVSTEDYSKHEVFQSLALEMVDVKAMAASKLEEWLVNESGSFIRFRWNAPLRTVQRRWINFLERQFMSCSHTENEKEAAAVILCKAKKLIVESVNELNELGETRLMSASAEGFSTNNLKLLVAAGAKVNAARPDGVTPVWLAAQFGHVECIRSLYDLRAEVNKAANDGATPIYIAAQNGNDKCIKILHELNADVSTPDGKGLTAVHQAAMNGQVNCINLLHELNADVAALNADGKSALDLSSRHAECSQLLRSLTGASPLPGAQLADHAWSMRKLIISTGDISDVDGFFALAEYAKTGADVLFVLNYPAYIGVDEAEADDKYAERNPGLGYKYTAKEVFEQVPQPLPQRYADFLSSYEGQDHSNRMKSAMTDAAFFMANKVWEESQGGGGSLMFCIGGINAVNPFSRSSVKNEILVYSEVVPKPTKLLETKEEVIYDRRAEVCQVDWAQYADIYFDFNGSMAFWNDRWLNKLNEPCMVSKLRGVVVMGGVHADQQPSTMPSIPGVLNRFSSATMNQLYHPQKMAEFFAFLNQHRIEVFTVTNNVVADLMTFADESKAVKTYDGVDKFLTGNGLSGAFLRELAQRHYTSQYNPPRKAFDYYTAVALRSLLLDPADGRLRATPRALLYSNVYGITFVSEQEGWEETRAAYARTVQTEEDPGEAPFVRAKKEYFRKELNIMRSLTHLPSLRVYDLAFAIDDATGALSLALPPASSA